MAVWHPFLRISQLSLSWWQAEGQSGMERKGGTCAPSCRASTWRDESLGNQHPGMLSGIPRTVHSQLYHWMAKEPMILY